MNPWILSAIAFGFPLYFVAIWLGVTHLLSRFAWRALAAAFTATAQPKGQIFPIVSASIGGVNYNNCLTAVVGAQGLWLQPWKPFRPSHPPLLIPWRAFSTFQETQILWAKRLATTVQIPDGRAIKFWISPAALAEAAQANIGRSE